MAKQAKAKAKPKAKANAKAKVAKAPLASSGKAGPYFYIRCDLDGVIIGATSPDEDLDGTIKNPGDFKLKRIGGVVLVDEITFQKEEEFGPCVWKKVGSAWVCV